MKKFIFVFLVVFLVLSFIFNIINDFDILALIINVLALIGLLTVGRSTLIEKSAKKDRSDRTNYQTNDRK